MTRLAVRIEPVEDATLDTLVVHVRQPKTAPQRLLVPIGGSREIAVEPGRVVVEARLPSGRSVVADKVVAGDADEIVLAVARDPLAPRPRGSLTHGVWYGALDQLAELRPDGPGADGVEAIDRTAAGWRIRLRQRGGEGGPRHALVVAGAEDGRVVLLPFPWGGGLEVLVQPPEDGGPPAAKVLLRDFELGPLIAYLHGGDLGSAREVAAGIVAEQRLMGKMSDPLGATVGGYALLALREYGRLHDWPRNLWRRFSWLPDGGIIWATQLLRLRGDLDEAGRALLEAHERGVPYFSSGVRLLVDGLRAVLATRAWRGDAKLTRALEDSERLSLFVDPEATATSLVGAWSELEAALSWKAPFVTEGVPA